MTEPADQDKIDGLRDRLERALASVERQVRVARSRLAEVDPTAPIGSEKWTDAPDASGKVQKSAEKAERARWALWSEVHDKTPSDLRGEVPPSRGAGTPAGRDLSAERAAAVTMGPLIDG